MVAPCTAEFTFVAPTGEKRYHGSCSFVREMIPSLGEGHFANVEIFRYKTKPPDYYNALSYWRFQCLLECTNNTCIQTCMKVNLHSVDRWYDPTAKNPKDRKSEYEEIKPIVP